MVTLISRTAKSANTRQTYLLFRGLFLLLLLFLQFLGKRFILIVIRQEFVVHFADDVLHDGPVTASKASKPRFGVDELRPLVFSKL